MTSQFHNVLYADRITGCAHVLLLNLLHGRLGVERVDDDLVLTEGHVISLGQPVDEFAGRKPTRGGPGEGRMSWGTWGCG